MGALVSAFTGGGGPDPIVMPPMPTPRPPTAPAREKRKARRGKIGKSTQLTGPGGLGDTNVKTASILGG